MIISAEIQFETPSAYVSRCWRERSVGKPGRLLPSAGWDAFLQGNHARATGKLLLVEKHLNEGELFVFRGVKG